MITTTSFLPSTSNVIQSGSQRATAAVTSAPATDTATVPATPSAVFIRSERYQAMENTQAADTARPVAPTGAAAPATATAVSLIPGAEARAQQTSGNILGFIGLQLQRDVADGADTDALSSRILAGLEGFKQGFTEAAEQLSAMGLMTEELKAELQLTYDQVMAGAEELHQQFVATSLELDPADAGPLASMAASAPAASPQHDLNLNASAEDFTQYVTEQLLGQRQGVDALLAYLESLSVETEPVAVNQLLVKVTELAESYTSGGVQEAYKEAVALGYSEQDIGLFVQQLGQPSVQRAQQAYGSVQPQAGEGDLAGRLQPLVNYAQQVRDVQDTASRLQLPEDVLVRMTEVVNTGSDSGFQRLTVALANVRDQ